MLYNYKEILEKYESNYGIKKAIKDNKLFKVEKGIYSDTENINYLELLMKKYPFAIINGISAYYYYDLTDYIPDKVTVCTDRHSTRIKDTNIKQIQAIDTLYNLGVSSYKYDNVAIKIYDKERLLIDLIRDKSKMRYDLYKEIINNYRKNLNNLDIQKIENYLSYFYNENSLFKKIQDEVF